jgi:hypothetical protein
VASAVITIIQHMRTTTTAASTGTNGGAAGGSANSSGAVSSSADVSERTRCLRFLARAAKSPKLAHRCFNKLNLSITHTITYVQLVIAFTPRRLLRDQDVL